MTEDKKTGKAAGGYARAAALTFGERKEIARKAAVARWTGPIYRATHGSADHPLKIGDIEIPCYVLDDGTRVLSQRGLRTGVGMSASGGSKRGEPRLVAFFDSMASKGIDIKHLTARIRSPIRFLPPGGGRHAYGYEATILADICDVVLAARHANALQAQQIHIAERCEILVRGFARVGIIALVDEATGYQGIRPQDALQAYLEKVISRELAAWVKKFPDEFYENIYKLKNWYWPGMGKNRYSVVGHYTRDLVYDRLGPGVLKELEEKSPKDATGNRANKFHQWLSEDIGNSMLAQHLHSLIMFQRLALASGYGWNRFVKMVDQVMPKKGATIELALTDPSAPTEPPQPSSQSQLGAS
ncbi:MAG: P63C domain-containing protein [Gammaproteobacteria bacterium]